MYTDMLPDLVASRVAGRPKSKQVSLLLAGTLRPTYFAMQWQNTGEGQRTKEICIGKGERDDFENPNPVQARLRE